MQVLVDIIAWFQANAPIILGILFALSEGLSLIPSVKANGVFQLIFGWLQKNKPAA